MAKIKTADLIGATLDWAVATCEGLNCRIREKDDLTKHVVVMLQVPCPDSKPGCAVAHYSDFYYRPSTDPAQAYPIIEREKIAVDWDHNCWNAAKDGMGWYVSGPTPLIAAMRCYVASKLGNEVEIPDELINI